MPLDLSLRDPGTGVAARINQDGAVYVSGAFTAHSGPVSGTLYPVTGTVGSGVVLLATRTRVGFTIYNNSTQICYVTLGTTASSSSFSFPLVQNAFYESSNTYSGPVVALWDAPVTGSALVMEYT